MSAPTRAEPTRRATPASPAPAQALTFVFTDIEGSTRLLEVLHERYADVLASHGRLIGAATARAGGEVVDTQGDAFFLAFATADQAVAFAADAQRALAREHWPARSTLRVRMGIHAGEATRTASGYVGLDVHRTARISSVAHGGQVLLSAEAAGQLGNGTPLKALGSHGLKDFSAPVALHQLVIEGLPTDFPPPRSVEEPDQPPAEGEPPYQGLAHFEEADAPRFFGREKLVARLVARLGKRRFLAVIGASGSGKSSVVRAGLIPALRQKGVTRVVLLTPTADPFAALAAALLPDAGESERSELAEQLRFNPTALAEHLGAGSLLVLDQAEELFSLARDDGERAAFIERLLTATKSGGHVVLTLRADFYDRLAGYPALRDLVAAQQEYLGQMSPAELRAAIEGPAQAGGWRFDAGLVDLILHDVGAEPGALPLLSHALLETWQRRRGRLMMLRGYLESGGVQGAIARSADRLMAELEPEQQAIARTIFLRLTEFGAGTPDTRRRAALAELLGQADGAAASDVLQRLAEHRLVVLGTDTAEVAHEALIREWPTLREWLAADREALRLHRGLTDAAGEWQRAGREPSLLFRGARLAAALDWAPDHAAELNDLEREFIEASSLASEREAQRQRQINRRLRFLLAGACVFLVVAIGAGVYAALEANRAQQEEARAEEQARLARSRELSASALAALAEDPPLAKLLALSAAALGDPSVETLSLLHRAWAADRIVDRYSWPADRPDSVENLVTDLHPAGRLVAAWNYRGYMEVADLQEDRVVWSRALEHESALWFPGWFSVDGQYLFAGAYWETPPGDPAPPDHEVGVYVWESATGAVVARHDVGPCGGRVAGRSEHLLLVLTLPADTESCDWTSRQLEVVELNTGDQRLLATSVDFAAISADGSVVAFDRVLPDRGNEFWPRIVDLTTGEQLELTRRESRPARYFIRSLNHDGSLLLYGDGPMEVWDVAAREVVGTYDGHAGFSLWAYFAPDGKSVYSTGDDSALRHWPALGGADHWAIPSVGAGRPSATADGLVLVPHSDTTQPAVLVDTSARGEILALETCPGWLIGGMQKSQEVITVVVNCDGQPDYLTHVFDLSTGGLRYPAIGGHQGQSGGLSPDGRLLARQSGFFEDAESAGPIEVRDLRTGDPMLQLEGMCDWDPGLPSKAEAAGCSPYPETPFAMWVNAIEWSPDGTLIAGSDHFDYEGFTVLWSAESGRIEHAISLEGGRYLPPIFSPDSRRLIASHLHWASEEWSIRTHSTVSGELVSVDSSITEPLTFVGFSPDGEVLHAIARAGFPGGGSLYWLDAHTLRPIREPVRRIHDSRVRASALRPDGSLVATGATDGLVRVWDAATGGLVHEVAFGNTEVQGIAFLNDRHLAVALRTGNVYVVTLDTDELNDIVRASLTRGFTETECARYGFGDECPTLEEMRSGAND